MYGIIVRPNDNAFLRTFVVLDSALEYVRKATAKGPYSTLAVVDKDPYSKKGVIRAFGINGMLRWALPCVGCAGFGKLTSGSGFMGSGTQEECMYCHGWGVCYDPDH